MSLKSSNIKKHFGKDGKFYKFYRKDSIEDMDCFFTELYCQYELFTSTEQCPASLMRYELIVQSSSLTTTDKLDQVNIDTSLELNKEVAELILQRSIDLSEFLGFQMPYIGSTVDLGELKGYDLMQYCSESINFANEEFIEKFHRQIGHEALKYLHEKNLIYRDWRLENVLVNITQPNIAFVLTDFSHVVWAEEKCKFREFFIKDDICLGLSEFAVSQWQIAAPEILFGRLCFAAENTKLMKPVEFPTYYSLQTDLFGYGCLLYWLSFPCQNLNQKQYPTSFLTDLEHITKSRSVSTLIEWYHDELITNIDKCQKMKKVFENLLNFNPKKRVLEPLTS